MAESIFPVRAPSRIVLTGFMGSGKTTVGQALALRLGWGFVDLDEHVAAREQTSVPKIIAERGEAAFRLAELTALDDLLTRSQVVVALGGGAPETPDLRRLLQADEGTLVIYLEGSFEVLYARCLAQSADPTATARPFLGDPASTRGRFDRRVPLYNELAGLVVKASSAAPGTLAETIHRLLTSVSVPS